MSGRAGHVPERRCVGCGRQRPRTGLVRVTRGPEGAVVDAAMRLGGRGAYVCRDNPACARRALDRGSFARALKAPLGPAGAVLPARLLEVCR